MRKTKLFFLLSLLSQIINAQDVKVTSGKVIRFSNFKSQFIDARNIDIWLPDNYSNNEKYAVLYMHDGNMLYDAESTWNKQAWEVDEVAGKLISEGKTQKFIVIGIWNNGAKRHPEYFPQKPYESLSQIQKDTVTARLKKSGKNTEIFKPYSDLYLKFLVTELKPFIDYYNSGGAFFYAGSPLNWPNDIGYCWRPAGDGGLRPVYEAGGKLANISLEVNAYVR